MTKHNPWHLTVAVLILTAFVLGLATGPQSVQALSLGGGFGTIIKIFGIAYIVSHYGDKIDGVINNLLGQHQAEIEGKTKVVPILRVGGGTAIGAAQVMGPAQQVDKVRAVAEVEWKPSRRIRARGLIPISTEDASTVRGVGGVGVSANIKFPL